VLVNADIVMMVCDRRNLAGHLVGSPIKFVRCISNHIDPKFSSNSWI